MYRKKKLKPLPILSYSGFKPKMGKIDFIKKHQYYLITDIAMAGDAPKDFLAIYEYGFARKTDYRKWPKYIAKHGHKYYPMESITEYLIYKIGKELGYNVAEAKLASVGGQIRFLSKYFIINPCTQVLEHGADLYAGYLNNDKKFVDDVEGQRMAHSFFTVQFTETVFKHFYPNDYQHLMVGFIDMLVYDAIVGNNDRHFYNWGILKNIKNEHPPVFAPIYDTARGLFWNELEPKIIRKFCNKNETFPFIIKYCNNSMAKIGWEEASKLNHFKLIKKVLTLPYASNCKSVSIFNNSASLSNVLNMIDEDFKTLTSASRKALIKECIKYRYDKIKEIFNTFAL
jgi:hypothetical protein